ncbi:hypothetical protein ASE01_00540 [Nocardioides sp. Root190]|nr:hypothetical protein ASE01_00540 [Nocardioides sp. Root190]
MVLNDIECWELLQSRPVGRIAWFGLQGVSVIPVNFEVADNAIVLRTTPYSMMARDSADRQVAFEVDLIDDEHHSGWSVLARGRCTRLHRSPDTPGPWVTGPRILGMRIEVQSISGRRILQPDKD